MALFAKVQGESVHEYSLSSHTFYTAYDTNVSIMCLAGEASLAEIMPSLGPELGGTVVEINGAGFLSSPLFVCRFGRDHAASVTFVSSTRVLCTAPPGIGAAKVEIAINGQNTVPAAGNQFDFQYQGILVVLVSSC